MIYLCNRFRLQKGKSETKGSEKKVEKIFQKDLVVSEKGFTFAPLSAPKMSGRNRRPKGWGAFEKDSSYSNIRTAFFEVFEQLLVLSTLFERVISNNTFEIRAKD